MTQLFWLAVCFALLAFVWFNRYNAVMWAKIFWASFGAALMKRGTPEQEDEANKNYRRGGDGNIPLPYKRSGQRKSIFDFFRKEK